MNAAPGRVRGDGGQVGGVEGLAFGFFVFALGILLVANAWGVIDAKVAASAAAREGARAFVESRAASTAAARSEAVAAIDEALVAHGRSVDRRDEPDVEGALQRCARVTVVVRYHVPLITIPAVGRYGSGFTATGRHSEIVDPFRSGLRDRNTCPPVLTP